MASRVCVCCARVFVCCAYGERALSLAAGLEPGAGSWGCVAAVELMDSAATKKGMWV